MTRALALLLMLSSLLLSACGGGSGGSSNSPAVVPTPPPAPRSIDFTFFGTSDPAVTAPFTNVYHVADWGPANAIPDIKMRMIAEMQAARARGVDRFILSTGFLQFDAHCNYLGNAALAAFKIELDAADLSRSVYMLYPKDEPENAGCTASTMAQAYREALNIWPSARIGVIYGPSGNTPGIDQATDVGRDNYGHGPQVLSLRSDQHLMIICSGVEPARDDIQGCVDYAKAHANVSTVWAFLYVAYTDPAGHPQQGIGTNGSLPAFRTAGCELTLKC
jgi:hypothetical protein